MYTIFKIKNFDVVAVGSGHQGCYGYPCPPFKIIILNDANSMTEDAHNALCHTMETYSDTQMGKYYHNMFPNQE
ncbi:unnamed protein product [Lactuca virosa]|uniref:Uncharacterized protein n=1 Tax=Lactuca virosa TaxID=75947 RepID=A0AAU9NTQ6_9ASTR|nr:unnamed protein product [Lactuca virosa]